MVADTGSGSVRRGSVLAVRLHRSTSDGEASASEPQTTHHRLQLRNGRPLRVHECRGQYHAHRQML